MANGDRSERRRDPEAARELLEELFPDRTQRKAIAEFFVEIIRHAHTQGPRSWSLTLSGNRVALLVAGTWVCALWEEALEMSLVENSVGRAQWNAFILEPGIEKYRPFKVVSGTRYIVDADAFGRSAVRAAIDAGVRGFLEQFEGRRADGNQLRTHSPGVLEYLRSFLSTDVPDPQLNGVEEPVEEPGEPPPARRVTPELAFKDGHLDVNQLLNYIEVGDLALPELQRPFVWQATKVRALFDSMYQGFPIGTLMIWHTQPDADRVRSIGTEKKRKEASMLVVDGQQRLTSLYAVIRGKPVMNSEFRRVEISIAFRPRDATFEVADAHHARDPEWVPNISALWASTDGSYSFITGFIEKLEKRRPLTKEDKAAIAKNIEHLHRLTTYPFSTLDIRKDVNEEMVADIFVRINNGGTKLRQADFILTLLSVHSQDTRDALEDFAEAAARGEEGNAPSPKNPLIQPSAAQLLRVAISVAFHRARLSAVYQLLRGRDPDTEDVSPEFREKQLEKLRAAVAHVLDLQNWADFIHSLIAAGFRSDALVSNENALLNSYALFLVGKLQYRVQRHELSRYTSRWFFASSLTQRYSGSTETQLEEDLGRVRDLTDASAFLAAIENAIGTDLTDDYWSRTLPANLETTGSSPVALAFRAAQIRLGAPVLFSDRRIADLYDSQLRGARSPVEEHHLFPRRFLARSVGILETSRVNQAGNLALVEWPDNVEVSDRSPAEYVPDLRKRFSTQAWDTFSAHHALPPDWEKLSYEEFLVERRRRMAQVIRRGFEALADREPTLVSMFGNGEEQQVWQAIEKVELALRDGVRTAFRAKWGEAYEEHVLQAFKEDERSSLEQRRAKHERAFPLSGGPVRQDALSYLYLGDLARLVNQPDGWDHFRSLLKEKRALQGYLDAISPVRNDRAHFRPVPAKELQRCAVACDDLLTLLGPATRPSQG